MLGIDETIYQTPIAEPNRLKSADNSWHTCHTPSTESATDLKIPQTALNLSHQKRLTPLIELSRRKIARTLRLKSVIARFTAMITVST